MPKITFMGAGSTVFAINVLGDSMLSPALQSSRIALYDIDATRLAESERIIGTLNRNINKGRAKITAHCGVRNRKAALDGADFVINAIQVGGYKPSTVIDFEAPKKYGLRQTIGDTLGIGGIFRALRTIPVMLDFARDMEAACPDAWFLTYSNPMAMLTGAMLHGTGVKTVGLCHSVQGCARGLLWELGLDKSVKDLKWHIAGINHQAWLLEVKDGRRDLYPEIKRRAAATLKAAAHKGFAELWERGTKHGRTSFWADHRNAAEQDLVRLDLMLRFGHYVTESSEHNAEYMPYFIKATHPELIDHYNIPLDEYPRRCVHQIKGWKKLCRKLLGDKNLSHTKSHEFGAPIMEAIATGTPIRVHGNIVNHGLITNLPAKAIVEVPCLVDRNGVQGCYVGDLPEQCAALNRTNINPQLVTIEAALTRKKDLVYNAAMLDPHTSSELSLDQIVSLCDDLIKAHGNMLPTYR